MTYITICLNVSFPRFNIAEPRKKHNYKVDAFVLTLKIVANRFVVLINTFFIVIFRIFF